MDKKLVRFICNSCDSIYLRWQGKCDHCNAWNSLEEEMISKSSVDYTLTSQKDPKLPIPIAQVPSTQEFIVPSKINEFDRVLGRGFVKGSVILLGGEPGIGKSTLGLQLAQNVAREGLVVLYISGEESTNQIRLRAERIGKANDKLLVYSQVNILNILKAIKDYKPEFIILDSIQVVYHPQLPSIAGSVNQVRYCASELISIIKEKNIFGLLIGHVTKDGSLAGPKVLEHLVDVILNFEGERNQQYRILRSFKNRYSNTNEIGIFEMQAAGLAEIPNPSELFIDNATLANAGSVISSVLNGDRAVLVEMQALVVNSGYGMAKRTFLGVDNNRANLMIAAIEKILGYKLSQQDIILNIIGGLKVVEPALDLTIVMAIVSSLYDKPLKQKTGVLGEVGLTGEIRPVPNIDKRLIEFEKMGFTACIVPHKNSKNLKTKHKMQIYYVKNLREAVKFLLGSVAKC
ncbi:DNA repair protein RadA [Candidatus Margulisiibacteriota bacterium]